MNYFFFQLTSNFFSDNLSAIFSLAKFFIISSRNLYVTIVYGSTFQVNEGLNSKGVLFGMPKCRGVVTSDIKDIT